MIDYVLTIAISVAAGCDAIFSFLAPSLAWLKLPAEFADPRVLDAAEPARREGVGL